MNAPVRNNWEVELKLEEASVLSRHAPQHQDDDLLSVRKLPLVIAVDDMPQASAGDRPTSS